MTGTGTGTGTSGTASVVVCTWQGVRADPPEERDAAFTLARGVAAEIGAELRWLMIGDPVEGHLDAAVSQGVVGIDHVAGSDLRDDRPDALTEGITRYCDGRRVEVLLFSQGFGTRVIAPRVAARLRAAVVMNATAIAVTGEHLEVTASAYGGDTRAVYELDRSRPAVIALLPNAVEPETVDGGSVEPSLETVEVDLGGVVERVRVVDPAHSEGPRLEDAEVIVAGGRGLGAQENLELVEQLAEALGGMSGVSRPLVDAGWIDSSHQVGLTGKYTRPGLYIAAGISGATQHMVGCAAAKTIVAINTDPDAAIFSHARFGIVGDCTEVLAELTRAVKDTGAS